MDVHSTAARVTGRRIERRLTARAPTRMLERERNHLWPKFILSYRSFAYANPFLCRPSDTIATKQMTTMDTTNELKGEALA